MDDGAQRFMTENANDFTVLWFSVNNEIKKRYPDLTHQPMRTDAYIARALIRFEGIVRQYSPGWSEPQVLYAHLEQESQKNRIQYRLIHDLWNTRILDVLRR